VTVYIELVIFNNFTIDMMLLLATATVRRRKVRVWRLLAACAAGSAVATAYALMPEWAQIVTRFLLSPVLCIVFMSPCGSNRRKKIGDYIATVFIFSVMTFFLGGIVYGLSHILGVDVKSYATLGLAAMGVATLIITARLIARKKTAKSADTRSSVIYAGGTRLKAEALCDSGNMLVDEISGLPVVILSQKVEESLPRGEIKGFINVSTVGGENSLPLIDIDEIEVNGKRYKAIGALSRKSFDNFDIILQNSMF